MTIVYHLVMIHNHTKCPCMPYKKMETKGRYNKKCLVIISTLILLKSYILYKNILLKCCIFQDIRIKPCNLVLRIIFHHSSITFVTNQQNTDFYSVLVIFGERKDQVGVWEYGGVYYN